MNAEFGRIRPTSSLHCRLIDKRVAGNGAILALPPVAVTDLKLLGAVHDQTTVTASRIYPNLPQTFQ